METKVVMVKELFNADMLEWYSPDEDLEVVHIHFPAYVNILKDSKFEAYIMVSDLEIRNERVWVTLGMTYKRLHITVFK